jgi:hypothetical protein
MRAKRPDKALLHRRVEEILRIRLDGAEFWDVVEFVREKEAEAGSAWHLAEGDKPLTDAALRRYLCHADKLVAESCRASRRKLLRRHLAQRRNLYAKAVSQGDVKAALAVLRDEAELLDLYPSAEAKLAAEVEALKKILTAAEARRAGEADRGERDLESRDPGAGAAGAGPGGIGADSGGAPPG